jgi:hypothetical protein
MLPAPAFAVCAKLRDLAFCCLLVCADPCVDVDFFLHGETIMPQLA